MNKDVIYIEPEDDITDIITRIENAKSKIVALVPPKKATVLRSMVNIKLIHKAGFTADKTIVLVTTDPAIMKLAATVKMPVTKDLQSAPSVPDVFATEDTTSTEEQVDTDENGRAIEGTKQTDEGESTEVEANGKNEDAPSEEEIVGETKNTEGEPEKELKKSEKVKKKKVLNEKFANNKVLNWIVNHKAIAIGCGVGVIVLILVLIWAFVIAPAVTITVGVRTETEQFRENVTFTTNIEEENSSEGKFYLEEKKFETKSEVEFEATGEKNLGEKASGTVTVYVYLDDGEVVSVKAGTKFTSDGLVFTSNKDVTFTWEDSDTCENDAKSVRAYGCQISTKLAVTAAEPGEKYNIAASDKWTSSANVDGVFSDKAMTGGTDKIVTVVQQSDIDKALTELKTENESENKQKLLDMLDDDDFVIDSSFKQTTSDPVSTPALGEEVKSGEKAKLTVTTTDSIYVIDEAEVKTFISEKAKLDENDKIYEMKEPFIENFVNTENGYIGKLKTSYVTGPKVTENEITELVRGKGLGEASKNITSTINGISEVHIDPSFPWVYSVPNDTNKITVIINIKE